MTTKLRPTVQWFAEQMELELRKHDDYRGKKGWRSHRCTLAYLFGRLHEEVEELVDAYGKEGVADIRIAEAVDVANFAMMIADHSRSRHVGD